jgi:hypothetical protein
VIIPVYVQQPNKPATNRRVGEASDLGEPETVARKVGIPEGCLVDGKVVNRKGERRWSLVAHVRVVES